MGCEETRQHLEAYTLGALEPGERTAVERHLAECADCRAIAREMEEAAYAMPQALSAASPMRPHPAVKERLLDSIGLEITSPGERARPAPAGAPKVSRLSALSRSLRRRLRPLTVAATFLLLLLAASVAWSLHLTSAVAQERAMRAEFAELLGQQEIVLEVVDSNRTVKRVLRSPEGAPSYGKLYTRTDMAHVVAMAARLPRPPEGKAYHLWLTRGTRIELAGVMSVNNEGFGLLVFEADAVGPEYDSAVLTLQSVGSIAPASDVVLTWQPQ